jgi:hypothetical protein
MRQAMPAISETYSGAAVILAQSYYDESRSLAPALATAYAAKVSAYNPVPDIDSAIGYSIARLTNGGDPSKVLGMLAGTMQRSVANADRQTISFNIAEDPDGTMYERIPQQNACAFCLTMAAVAELQTENFFTKYHDYCRCVTMPVFTGQSSTKLPIYSQVNEAYDLAGKQLQSERQAVGYNTMKSRVAAKKFPELTLTTENYLKKMRQTTGWK